MKGVMVCHEPARGTALSAEAIECNQPKNHGLRGEAFPHGGLTNLRRSI